MRLEMAQQRSQGQNVWNGMDLYDEGHPESVFEHSLSDTRFPLHSTNDDNNKNSVENGRHLNLHSRKLDPLPTSQRVPDARDHKTVVSMVRMALDAYVDPKEQGWVDIGDGWEVGASFGWLESGLRGYIFVSEDQTTVVVGIKGTSLQLFGTGGGPTANNDKLNCSQQCLADDLKKDRDQGESYYDMGLKLIETTKTLYPKASIWLTGHSLGGSVASMIGITKGYPTFTFSAPGDVRFAQRLGIVPHKLSKHKLASQPVWQFGQTADPIFMGTCNGPTSICNSAGFIVETKCHLGNTCIYDTIEGLGWSQNIQAHALSTFISMVEDWGNMTNGSAKVPTCAPQADCQDCTQWEYV
ncbi:putative lipase atg15 [Mortierella claussenii]|nr:putative lipase atg15 [Mortierella claussenii]